MENLQFSKKKTGFAILMIFSTLLASACSGAVPTDIPMDEEEQVVAETVQAMSTEIFSLLTPEPRATTSSPPPGQTTTTTDRPQTFNLPEAANIHFTLGATYGAERGTIEPGQTQNYVLRAQQGQPMLTAVVSPHNDVTMAILSESGSTLLPASLGWSNWQGILPATQDYYIQVIGGTSQQNFSLWVSIPSRLEFPPGATTATNSGQTVDGNIASYVVAAQGGQIINIVLVPEPNLAALTVWGFSDGQPYIRAQMGSTSFNMQLPSTQDYIIDVVPQGNQIVNFTLRVDIE